MTFNPSIGLPFLAACNRLRYCARFGRIGEGTDLAGGRLAVFTGVIGFELVGVGTLGLASPLTPFRKLGCDVVLALGTDGTCSGAEGRFKL